MCIEQTMESPLVDYIIKKEGEETLYELTKYLMGESDKELPQIKGVCWREKDRVIINEDREFVDINTLPFPYSTEKTREFLITYRTFSTNYSLKTVEPVVMELSRGCPYSCKFCYNRFFSKNIARIKSIDKIEKELTILKDKYNIKEVGFYDDSLCGGNRKRIEELCELLQKLGLKWQSAIRANYIDDKMAERLEKSNCHHVFIGLESNNDRILKKFNKGYTSEIVYRAVRTLRKYKIYVSYSVIIGYPGETREDLNNLLDFVDEVRELHPNSGIAVQPFLPLPGTDLYQESIDLGFTPPSKLEDWADFAHDEFKAPWVSYYKDLSAIYLVTYVGFRYKWYLKNSKIAFIYYLFHKISLWRWEKRYFSFYFEGIMFKLYKKFGKPFIYIQRQLENLYL
ncbi:MAG: B12-binding domain-containing radical SAM protein [Nitrospinae bacterium]|nr:B12-binding domain-containing radical SAM protein [Nitrospinota bacterium]